MYTHLMVSLDGSVLAEAVLPVAHLLAERLGATNTLLHLIEAGAPAAVHGERHITTEADGQSYLVGVAATFPAGVVVDAHVHSDAITQVATQIVDHARGLGVDLIVMCTHGRGDPAPVIAQYAQEAEADLIVLATHRKRHLDAFWSGSVPPKVSNRSRLPLLLVPAAT